MDVLITGGNGYIAQGLYRDLKDVNITLLTRKDVDLLDSNQVDNYFKNKKFDTIIHTASVGGSRLHKDGAQVCFDNLVMFFNLRKHLSEVETVIIIGSGAELDRRYNINENTKDWEHLNSKYPIDPYGMGKRIIKELSTFNTVNLRVYNVFDSTELDTRFIKKNIMNYINKKPIEIKANKLMSFFSLTDLSKIIQKCFTVDLPNLDCVYEEQLDLVTIADKINKLSDYRVNIILDTINNDLDYMGKSNILMNVRKFNSIKFDGFDASLKNMYNILKNGL